MEIHFSPAKLTWQPGQMVGNLWRLPTLPRWGDYSRLEMRYLEKKAGKIRDHPQMKRLSQAPFRSSIVPSFQSVERRYITNRLYIGVRSNRNGEQLSWDRL